MHVIEKIRKIHKTKKKIQILSPPLIILMNTKMPVPHNPAHVLLNAHP